LRTRTRDTGGDDLVSRVFCWLKARKHVPTAGSAGKLLSVKVILIAWFVCAAAGVARADASDPVAVVNGARLESWELDRELAVRISVGSYHREVSAERRAELRCEALDILILKELKRQWALANPVEVDPSAAEAAWREVRQRFKSDEQYSAALATKGIAEAAFRSALARDAVAEAVDRVVDAGVEPATATEVEVFFILHGDDYMTPEARHVVDILFYVPPSATREEWQEAERRARELVSAARSSNASLLVIGKTVLEALPPRFRDQVGDIGFVHRGSLQTAVDAAVFSAQVGEVTDPVSSIFGYHVLQVISTRPSQPVELAVVRDAVEERIIREKRQRRLEEFDRELSDGATIEVRECIDSF
jgi:hypothetical protein